MRYTRLSLPALNACLLLAFGLTMSGCSSSDFKPKLSPVTGVITLNDKPLSDVTVTFEPQLSGSAGKEASIVGRSSIAVTDSTGKYELVYNDGKSKGAVVGDHIVRIASAAGGGPAGGADALVSIPIPSVYNSSSNLKAQVKPAENTLDFKLVAKKTR